MRAATAIAFVALAMPARAQDDAMRASQSQVAQVATVAKTATLLCPGIEADDQAIRALLDDAQLTERDLMSPDRFGAEDEAVAHSFVQSLKEDPDFCAEVFAYLGDRAHLLRRKPGAPG